jgi:hypothetical protein
MYPAFPPVFYIDSRWPPFSFAHRRLAARDAEPRVAQDSELAAEPPAEPAAQEVHVSEKISDYGMVTIQKPLIGTTHRWHGFALHMPLIVIPSLFRCYTRLSFVVVFLPAAFSCGFLWKHLALAYKTKAGRKLRRHRPLSAFPWEFFLRIIEGTLGFLRKNQRTVHHTTADYGS